MKKLLIAFLFAGAIASMNACKEAPDNSGKTTVIEDSLNTVLPTWNALHIKVSEDNRDMNIIIGDPVFYSASPEAKAQKTGELAKMILRIYGPNNELEKGTLVVTKDIHNKGEQPKDGITIPIDFAALKKAEGQ